AQIRGFSSPRRKEMTRLKIQKALLIAALLSAGLWAAAETDFFTIGPMPPSADRKPPDNPVPVSPSLENFTDPAEFLASEYAVGNSLTREDIISYNELRLANGSPQRIVFLKGETKDNVPRLITADEQWNIDEIYFYGKPFEFDGNFTLQPEDYNNDGNPDYIYKLRAPDKNGCLYALRYTGRLFRGDSPTYIYICGETSDAPKLDRIDRDNFFLFTVDEFGFPKPQIFSVAEHLIPPFVYVDLPPCFYDIDDFENNGWIFTSSYENGVITLKGTAAVMYRAQKNTHMDIALKNYDELTGQGADVLVSSVDVTADYSHRSSIMTVQKELSPGIYRIEVTINDKTTFTEFYVY
ncbi:MAG: hypothetical protein K2N72_03050, partial [Oscillospiraceae bacterium]|nr:hypothetical protein [Oscillospiraceae bacterium]